MEDWVPETTVKPGSNLKSNLMLEIQNVALIFKGQPVGAENHLVIMKRVEMMLTFGSLLVWPGGCPAGGGSAWSGGGHAEA